jgi:hypothetical protein
MDSKAGKTMAVFLERYIRPPLTEMAAPEDTGPEPIQLSWSPDEILVRGSNGSIHIPSMSVRRHPDFEVAWMRNALPNVSFISTPIEKTDVPAQIDSSFRKPEVAVTRLDRSLHFKPEAWRKLAGGVSRRNPHPPPSAPAGAGETATRRARSAAPAGAGSIWDGDPWAGAPG